MFTITRVLLAAGAGAAMLPVASRGRHLSNPHAGSLIIRKLLLLLALLTAGALAYGRPKIVLEAQVLEPPLPGLTYFAESVAVDGDWALATATRSTDGSHNYPYQQLALLYRRGSDGRWAFHRVLADDATDAQSWNDPRVAMKNGLAAVSTSPLRTFRLVNGDWSEVTSPFPAPVGDPEWANGLTRIDGPSLVAVTGRCNFSAGTAEFTGAGWNSPRFVHGNQRTCGLANYSGSLDVNGNTLVVTNPEEDYFEDPPTALRIYGRTGPGAPWQESQSLPTGDYSRGVALLGDDLVVGDWHVFGNLHYRRGSSGWELAGHLPTIRGFGPYYDGAHHIARGGDFVVFASALADGWDGAFSVYRRHTAGGFEHVADLTSRGDDRLSGYSDVSGRTIVASARSSQAYDDGRLYFFELPQDLTVPAVLQDDFEDGDASDWLLEAGQFSVATRGSTRVLRQSSLTGQSVATLPASERDTQSIIVDIRPTQFSGADRWVGVATRYRNAGDYYYVTLRSSGTVQLRKLRDGVITTLSSKPFPVAINQTYRVQLESVGTWQRVFVNGVFLFETRDDEYPSGRVGLLTYRAAADFDNVVVTPGVHVTIYDAQISNGSDCEQFMRESELRVTGTGQWNCVYEDPYLRQASLTGVARVAVGPDTDDQAVESRLQVESFAANGTQDKWLGVLTRYRDESNYYYLVLRSSNSVSLRKLVNGQITELARADLTVTPGAWRRLRLEAVGSKLLGYVDGELRVEAVDTALPRGTSGIATYRTAARFDYFRVNQP